ncbi:MAG: DUF4256 domain-containing protein [Candidatus Altimarinota bacterium]
MYRKTEFKLPENFSRADYEKVFLKLLEEGKVEEKDIDDAVEEIKKEIDSIKREANDRSMLVLQTDGKRELLPEQIEDLLKKLRARFKENQKKHLSIFWFNVEKKLRKAAPENLWSLWKLEEHSEEVRPDVIDYDSETGEYIFVGRIHLNRISNSYPLLYSDILKYYQENSFNMITKEDFLKYKSIFLGQKMALEGRNYLLETPKFEEMEGLSLLGSVYPVKEPADRFKIKFVQVDFWPSICFMVRISV